jgi:hypothetical protein
MKVTARTGVLADKPGKVDGKTLMRSAIEKALRDPRLVLAIEQGMMGGILNRDPDRIADTSNPSHKVLGVRLDGDEIVADLEILDTPAGTYVRDSIQKGYNVVAKPVLKVFTEDKVIRVFRFHRIQVEVVERISDGLADSTPGIRQA